MSNTEPLHDRIAESFGRQRLLATLGARLLRVADGEVDIELPWSEGIQQQHGFVHAPPRPERSRRSRTRPAGTRA